MLQTQSEVPRFDTEWVVARLKQGGWNEEQAVALCDVFREVTRGLSSVADTKRLEEKIEGRIVGMEERIEGRLVGIEGRLVGIEGRMEGRLVGIEGRIEGSRLLMIGGFTIMGLGFAMLGFLIIFKEFLFLE